MMNIQLVIKNASLELNEWGKIHLLTMSRKTLIKYAARRVFDFIRQKPHPYTITWRTGLLAKSLIYEKEIYENQAVVDESLEDYFNNYFAKRGRCVELENCYNGEAAIEMYLATNEGKYLALIHDYISFLKASRKDEEGSVPYFSEGYDILTDGLMCCPFIFFYIKSIDKDVELQNIGINQICNFIKHGIDKYTNLPYHAYNLENDMQLGISGWGRGVGWFLTSIAISLKYMDNSLKEYKTIRETFKSVAISAMEYQHQDGLFKWSLLAHKGPVDTSASAMILYAMALGINLGIIDPCYRGAVKKGYNAFEPYIKDGKVTQAMGDCRGFAMYPQFEYGPYPWSNAFFLLLDSEIRNWGEYKS